MVKGTQPRWGWEFVGEGSQGRPLCRRPTLGFGTQSRWDWGEMGGGDVRIS